MDFKTSGIIIIGNEILSGKVQDANSFYLAYQLRKLGIDVRRISVIPDDIDVIGNETLSFSGEYNYVFTTGGVGPTHDDVTMAGIAQGFGVDLIEHPEVKKLLHKRYEDRINRAVLKMAMVPEGSVVEWHEHMRFPIVSFRNIFVFPGIPEYVRNKFPVLREKLRSKAYHLKRLFLNSHESLIAGSLNEIVESHRDVLFGSYPIVDNDEYTIVLTAESKSESTLISAVEDLLKKLPENALVKVE